MSYKCNRCIIFRGEPRGPCEILLKTLEHDRKMAKIRIRYKFSDVLCINAYPRWSSITHFVIPAPYTSTCDKIQISKITFIFLIFVRPFQAIRGSTPFNICLQNIQILHVCDKNTWQIILLHLPPGTAKSGKTHSTFKCLIDIWSSSAMLSEFAS